MFTMFSIYKGRKSLKNWGEHSDGIDLFTAGQKGEWLTKRDGMVRLGTIGKVTWGSGPQQVLAELMGKK